MSYSCDKLIALANSGTLNLKRKGRRTKMYSSMWGSAGNVSLTYFLSSVPQVVFAWFYTVLRYNSVDNVRSSFKILFDYLKSFCRVIDSIDCNSPTSMVLPIIIC